MLYFFCMPKQSSPKKLVGETLQRDLLTEHPEIKPPGWYIRYANIRDFARSYFGEQLNSIAIGVAAQEAYLWLVDDAFRRKTAKPLRGIELASAPHNYPRDLRLSAQGGELIIDPDSLILAHAAGSLSIQSQLSRRSPFMRGGQVMDAYVTGLVVPSSQDVQR